MNQSSSELLSHRCSKSDLIESRGSLVCRICGLEADGKIFENEEPLNFSYKPMLRTMSISTGLFAPPGTKIGKGQNIIAQRCMYDDKEIKIIRTMKILKQIIDFFSMTMDKAIRAAYIIRKLIKITRGYESNTIAAISIYQMCKEKKIDIPFKDFFNETKEQGINIKRNEFLRLLRNFGDHIDVKYEKNTGIKNLASKMLGSVELHVMINRASGGTVKPKEIIKEAAKLACFLKKHDKKHWKQPYSATIAMCDAFFKIMDEKNLIFEMNKTQFKAFLRKPAQI